MADVPDAARVIAAQEAIESGDPVTAARVLHDLEADLLVQTTRKWRCECGLTFRWPVYLDHHRLVVGCPEARAEAA